MADSYYCEKCNRTMREEEFYTSHNLEKYPKNGKLPMCKKCISMHVDNWDSNTFLWILQEIDVPWVPDEWNKLMAKFATDPSKVTGVTILGRYLSKMKLKQWKDYRWKDTEFIQELQNNKIKEAMEMQGYDAQQIAAAIDKASFAVPTEELRPPDPKEFSTPVSFPGSDDFGFMSDSEESDFNDDLTDEDRIYLKLKWGKNYKPDEWVALEQLYEEMIHSYDIQAAGDINTLKIACKCSLKANQLLDIGDIDGAQKATKMYDSLMKSGKWTAAQNKAGEEEAIDSVGQLVAICEKEGFIPRYYISEPKDHVDRVIEDMQKYTHDLIANESGLSQMIENAFKQMQEEKESIKAASEMTEQDEEAAMFNYDNSPITVADYTELAELEEEMAKEDDDFFEFFEEDGDDE